MIKEHFPCISAVRARQECLSDSLSRFGFYPSVLEVARPVLSSGLRARL